MVRYLGALLVIAAGCICGFSLASNVGNLEKNLRQLLIAFELMHCQIEFRMTPLPELCQILATACAEPIGKVFADLEQSVQKGDASNASVCLEEALAQNPALPELCVESFRRIGRLWGQNDLQSQLVSIQLEIEQLRSVLTQISSERPGRVKSYQALGVSCGLALAILLF